MASEQFNIMSLFQPTSSATTMKRKDSGADVADAITQLNSFKGFGGSRSPPSKSTPQPVTLTFTPSTGSTCISLYPRTKTFTLASPINSSSCIATCENDQRWRISSLPPSPDSEIRRFTFERVEEDDQVKEAFRRCSVVVPQTPVPSRRGTSVDLGRRLSVGHYSGGLTGFKLPYSPTA